MSSGASRNALRALALGAALAAALPLGEALAQGFPFDIFGDAPGGGAAARRRPAARPPGQEPAKAKKKSLEKPRAAAKPAAVGAPPPTGTPAAPYEPQLTRLTEILGALSFLRDICGGGDAEEWREKAAALLDAEAREGPRREKLTAAFNAGFKSYELTYRNCTPNARLAISRHLDEAARLSGDIAYRYGNP